MGFEEYRECSMLGYLGAESHLYQVLIGHLHGKQGTRITDVGVIRDLTNME